MHIIINIIKRTVPVLDYDQLSNVQSSFNMGMKVLEHSKFKQTEQFY